MKTETSIDMTITSCRRKATIDATSTMELSVVSVSNMFRFLAMSICFSFLFAKVRCFFVKNERQKYKHVAKFFVYQRFMTTKAYHLPTSVHAMQTSDKNGCYYQKCIIILKHKITKRIWVC